MLSGNEVGSIPVMAIESRIDELREEFRRSSLPVDFRSFPPLQEVIAELDRRPLVNQLRKINLGLALSEYAIHDYYRASEQRSKWVREELLLKDELKTFEQDLIEPWQPRFAAHQGNLLPDSDDSGRIRSGKDLFTCAEQQACFPLRSLQERFLTHGSYHILANRYVVGWHPDFMKNNSDVA